MFHRCIIKLLCISAVLLRRVELQCQEIRPSLFSYIVSLFHTVFLVEEKGSQVSPWFKTTTTKKSANGVPWRKALCREVTSTFGFKITTLGGWSNPAIYFPKALRHNYTMVNWIGTMNVFWGRTKGRELVMKMERAKRCVWNYKQLLLSWINESEKMISVSVLLRICFIPIIRDSRENIL